MTVPWVVGFQVICRSGSASGTHEPSTHIDIAYRETLANWHNTVQTRLRNGVALGMVSRGFLLS